MSTLYIVATPIGNLEDITLRALRILGEVDFILCEDTRITKRLLDHYKIATQAISYHQHSDLKKIEYILDLLARGKNLALVSDAGTPGISDPGGKLVQAVIERFGPDQRPKDENGGEFGVAGKSLEKAHQGATVQIESVPGPSAVTAALSISGIPTDKFIFLGFPPHKKGRQKFIRRVLESDYPVVVYESKHRIVKFLEELESLAAEPEEAVTPETEGAGYYRRNKKDKKEKMKKKEITSVVVCRELSKMFETVYRGSLPNIIEKIKASPSDQKGEFVVIIG
jgi:16S rRNA (cytidine1402-2'-O)-methyltransferase